MLWRLISRLWGADANAPARAANDAGSELPAAGSPGEWLQRAKALHDKGRLAAALESYRACAALDPENLLARAGIANTLSASWRLEECIDACAEALEAALGNSEIFSGYLLYSHYTAHPDARALAGLHRRYGELMSAAMPPAYDVRRGGSEDRSRPLRLGYLSRDFCMHSVASFAEPVIAHHDRSRYRVYCYYARAHRDAMTEHLAQLCDVWHDAHADSLDQLAARIHADEIDILVDLGGHTKANRLGVFARRPAPVQVTWLGYPDTTGLATVDYRITDAIADPPGPADERYSERLLRLEPPFLCYRPPADSPPAARRRTNESIVFGSFNVIIKVNEPLIDVWAQILETVPGSRMLIKSTLIEYDETARRLLARFAARGIGADRLELRAWTAERGQHLDAYNEIDIALDTFPYNGTTTTCEALWMGVPVVTRAGELHMSRVGASLLGCTGLQELVAHSAAEYAGIAVALARDAPRREALARSMRDRLAASPLLDHAGFTRKLESALGQAWSTWRETHERNLAAER